MNKRQNDIRCAHQQELGAHLENHQRIRENHPRLFHMYTRRLQHIHDRRKRIS